MTSPPHVKSLFHLEMGIEITEIRCGFEGTDVSFEGEGRCATRGDKKWKKMNQGRKEQESITRKVVLLFALILLSLFANPSPYTVESIK